MLQHEKNGSRSLDADATRYTIYIQCSCVGFRCILNSKRNDVYTVWRFLQAALQAYVRTAPRKRQFLPTVARHMKQPGKIPLHTVTSASSDDSPKIATKGNIGYDGVCANGRHTMAVWSGNNMLNAKKISECRKWLFMSKYCCDSSKLQFQPYW